ncbi:abhydrolase 6 family protein [Histoplasma capsulatum G186AR]|nr:abhydrolase 6 family protein [Histoplasma capsulatum]QSS75234.1 abhydrolase 6 family protein [Histoplasma capsulatum G186AR]
MKRTLLLVFIHGFKGGDDTFGSFPAHLRALVSHALPNIEVTAVVYPKFETKGDLNGCVVRFREWLQNTVIDVEVANGTPSPTVDPSVHVFLIGHSMGGIVAAETLLLLASEQLLPTPSSISSSKTSEAEGNPVEANTFMFPHIQGLLAFDTPFLGIAPGVVSYTAENHYKTATAAYGAISEVAGVFGWGGAKTSENKTGNTPSTDGNTKSAASALTPATSTSNTSSSTDDAAATPSWQRWGRYAMYAGAAGAVAAGGAAALYSQRDKFLEGWSWATSHLEFVGCLARPEELRRRVSATAKLQQERGIGCADFYTCLGKGAVAAPANSSTSTSSPASSLSRYILRSKMRTFCNLPADVDEGENKDDVKAKYSDMSGIKWIKATNDKATDETKAHMSMFSPLENPSFYDLAQQACELLIEWVDRGWYLYATPACSGDGSSSNPNDNGRDSSRDYDREKEFVESEDDVVLVD